MSRHLHGCLARMGLVCAGAAMAILISLVVGEMYLRVRELASPGESAQPAKPDPIVGWRGRPGTYRRKTSEYDVTYQLNSRGDNSEEREKLGEGLVLVLGDSHTFATGVMRERAWPAVLEQLIGGMNSRCSDRYRVYNMAFGSYSLSQEYLRLIHDGLPMKPKLVLVGLSIATDLYDLLPPEKAPFAFPQTPMKYFDIEAERLVLKTFNPDTMVSGTVRSGWIEARAVLDRVRVYQALRRTNLALMVYPALHRLGLSWWPYLDYVHSKELNETQRLAWNLVEGVLGRFRETLAARKIPLIVVIVPYAPAVYDAKWKWIERSEPARYERFIANDRLRDICERQGLTCVDVTKLFVDAARQGEQLHFPIDAHPNPRGHELIARGVEGKVKEILAAEESSRGCR